MHLLAKIKQTYFSVESSSNDYSATFSSSNICTLHHNAKNSCATEIY